MRIEIRGGKPVSSVAAVANVAIVQRRKPYYYSYVN